MGVANALAAWQAGVRWFDASFGRLGGCPFAPGATGNVATEELVFLFEEMGVGTGIDLERLLGPVRSVGELLAREPESDVARAMLAAPGH
jgi:hydroxymethylglutaryl-CoA lyase